MNEGKRTRYSNETAAERWTIEIFQGVQAAGSVFDFVQEESIRIRLHLLNYQERSYYRNSPYSHGHPLLDMMKSG
jgi:hypothetical protein